MEPVRANTIVIALQGPNATTRQEIQSAAREIRTQIQREIQQQTRGGANQAPGAQTAPVPPTPTAPRSVIIRPDGEQIFVGGSEFPFNPTNEIPPEAVDMAMAFFFTVVAIVIGLPISRAFARRMDRRAVPAQIPSEVTAQLGQLAQAVDAIALEVERISEGQRFTTRLLSEQRDTARQSLPAGSDR